MKEEKGKTPRISMKKVLGPTLKIYWRNEKFILLFCALAVVIRVALPFATIYMPKLALDLIQAGDSQRFLIGIAAAAGILIVLNYLKSFSDVIVNQSVGTVGIMNMLVLVNHKKMTMDYDLIESPEIKPYQDKLDKAMYSNHSPAMNLPRTLVEVLSNILGLMLYVAVVLTIHPAMLLVIALCAAVSGITTAQVRKYDESTRESRSQLFQRVSTLRETLQKPEAAKDMRLYGADGFLLNKVHQDMAAYQKAEDGLARRTMRQKMIDALLALLRDGLAYAYLIYLVLQSQLTLGEFVLMFAAVGALAGWIAGVIQSVSYLRKASVEMSDIQAYLHYPDRMNTGEGAPLPQGDALPPGIQLQSVSYTYPGAEKPTLSNIDLDIRPGERIAIVGANGAGKTTFVKLVCGLYQPTGGVVYLNGQPIGDYNRDAYYTLFSPVFQDIHLLSTDIAGNVSQKTPEETDMERVFACLRLAGLYEKVMSLPMKEKTLLVKNVNPEAIEFSGGEKQKLGMARALYKDAPVLILDEPTAALDPIAENEVYQKYAELTEGKTSFFITHRLASTRFCDRILLIADGGIKEQGTHEELMQKDGIYAHLFSVQASYYQKKEGVQIA